MRRAFLTCGSNRSHLFVELVSYCHSIYLVTQKKKKEKKTISSMDIFITLDCKRLVMSTPLSKQAESNLTRPSPTPFSTLQCSPMSPSSPSLHLRTHTHSSQSRTPLQADVAARTVMYYFSNPSN